MFIAGIQSDSSVHSPMLLHVDRTGDAIWTKYYRDFVMAPPGFSIVFSHPDSNLQHDLIFAHTSLNSIFQQREYPSIVRVNPVSGSEVWRFGYDDWTNLLPLPEEQGGVSFIARTEDGYILCGHKEDLANEPPPENPGTNLMLLKLVDIGANARYAKIPDVIGMPLDQAIAVIESHRLAVGDIDTAFHASLEAGMVIDQQPKCCTPPTDSLVHLAVSAGRQDRSKFEVEWGTNTIYFDSTELGAIILADTVEDRYIFSSAHPKAAALAPGKILVIHGLALRKVTSVLIAGPQVIVETGYATLSEAIKNGRIDWDYGIDFHSPVIPSLSDRTGRFTPFRQITTDSFSIEMQIGEYNYKIAFKLNGDHAEIDCEVEKDVFGAIKARFQCEGKIEQFRTTNTLVYENHSLKRYDHQNDDLRGDLTVSLTAAASGEDMLNLKFPVTLLQFPYMIGPIPVTINVKVQFVADSVVPLDGSSQVSARFGYDSRTGLKYNGTTVSVNGNMGTFSVDKIIAQTGASGAIAVNFGLGFPRLELALFGETVVPWIQTAFLVGGDFTFTPPCQQARAAFIGACGYNLKFLGLGLDGNLTLWKEEKVLLQSGDCPDGGLRIN